jgi:hypothetical protein
MLHSPNRATETGAVVTTPMTIATGGSFFLTASSSMVRGVWIDPTADRARVRPLG